MTSIVQRSHIVWWHELDKWVVPKRLPFSSFISAGWSFVKVGDIVSQVTNKIRVQPNEEYKMVGVKWYGEGTFYRETVKGGSQSATYLMPLVPNAFIYNRLFAWKGSFALVPEEHSDCFVSNEFPQFIVDDSRILPTYLYLFFMCDDTVKAVNKASIGSAAVSRNRFKEDYFLDFEIPLPPLPIQQAIVDKWQKAQNEIRAANQRVGEIKESLSIRLLRKLGMSLPPVTPRKGAFTIEWKDLERWDTFFYRMDFTELEEHLLSMRHARLGELLNFISRPWKASDFPEETFEYVEISSVTKDDGIIGSRPVNIKEAPSRATTLIKEGDLIIATTRPYLGAFAIVPEKYNNCICSSGFSLADTTKIPDIEKEFLLLFLKSPAGLRQLERRMTGGLYPAIVQDELEKILVPIPPLAMQREIIKSVKEGRTESEQEREAAERKSREIKAEIEAIILGTKQVSEFL